MLVMIEVEGEEPIVVPAALLNVRPYVNITVAESASDPNPRHYVLRHDGQTGEPYITRIRDSRIRAPRGP
jgi:hypothetical protein